MTAPTLRHYAGAPFVLDRQRVYPEGRLQATGMKPSGLWVTIPGEDDWPTWCRREDFAVDRLAVEYDGILIYPYHRSLRYELSWYSSWDVASGCIWNLDAIGSTSERLSAVPVGGVS